MTRPIRGDAQLHPKTFLRRGVTARHFLRDMPMANGIEVRATALETGLMKIDLVRRQVQPRLRTGEIKTGGS